MRISVWPDGSSPVYLNPDLKEIAELAASRVDTLRICEDEGKLAVASGYGNTHSSVTMIARKHWGNRWMGYDHILFRYDGDQWRWNLGCSSPADGIELQRGLTLVEPATAQFVKDFISFLK